MRRFVATALAIVGLILPSLPSVTLAQETPALPPRGEPIVIEGRGQTATNPVTLPWPISVATLTHDGKANFAVWAYAGTARDLLVNTIGPYRGQRPVGGTVPVTFDIKADGAWTLRIEPIGLGGSAHFGGTGDAVSALFDPPATGPWEVSHNGSKNFAVWLYCRSGRNLIQNTIGPIQASTVVPFGSGPCFWDVKADGAWSLAPRA